MSNPSTARVFLGLNAAFSIFIGTALLLVPETIAQIMFAEPGGWKTLILRGLGIGLLIFALDLVLMATNRYVTKRDIMLIVAADIGWIAGSAVLIIFFGTLFTSNGVVIIDVVVACVALFAIGQFMGARQIVAPIPKISFRAKNSSLAATVTREVSAPASVVWAVMNDHPGYADVASNIAKVEVLSGEGIGMERRCYGPKGESWEETCDFYEDGQAFGFRIHTEAPDYPYPFSALQGRWAVKPLGSGSEFSIELAAKPKGNFIFKSLFTPIARRQFTPVLITLADAWAKRMEHEAKLHTKGRP